MKRGQIREFTFSTLVCFYALITIGNAAFGDYMKKRFNNINHTATVDADISTYITQNVFHQTDSTPPRSEITPRSENFKIEQVRLYKNNPTPMFPDREKKMMESLFSGKTLKPGQTFDFKKQIYGAELEKEFGALLEQTSPSWDRLEALLKKAEKITRLPQSMYYDEEEEETKLRKPQSDTTNVKKGDSLGNIFKQRLQKIDQRDEMADSFDDVSMNFGRGNQIYPFGPDLSLPVGKFRRKREITRNLFSQFPPTGKREYYQFLREAQEQYFKGPPPRMYFQHPRSNKIAPNTGNFGPMMEKQARNVNLRNASYRNLKNNHFTKIYQNKITLESTKLTPHGTLDSTWKDLIKQLNPIQQKIIQDLFLYGPPTSTTLSYNSLTAQTSSLTWSKDTIGNPTNNNTLLFNRSVQSKFSIANLRIREITRTLRPKIRTISEKVTFQRQSQMPQRTTSRILRTSTMDRKLVNEWLKSLNPQDQKEIENLFLNGQSSPLYDINDIESIKNAIKNEYLREPINENGHFATNNLKSTFISRNDKRANTENLGYYNNYEDLSRLLKQAPQDKMKIVNDWCDEIEKDLHRRFPTAMTKEGETRGPRPLYATRYYPWELFSMLPPDQN